MPALFEDVPLTWLGWHRTLVCFRWEQLTRWFPPLFYFRDESQRTCLVHSCITKSVVLRELELRFCLPFCESPVSPRDVQKPLGADHSPGAEDPTHCSCIPPACPFYLIFEGAVHSLLSMSPKVKGMLACQPAIEDLGLSI